MSTGVDGAAHGASVTELLEHFARIEGLASALANRTPIENVARLLALRVLQDFDVYGVALVGVDAVGGYRVISHFGYDEIELGSLNSTTVNWRTPLATAIREGRSIWFDHDDASAWDEFPDMHNVPVHLSLRATVAMPIGLDVPVAGMLITLRQALASAPKDLQLRFFQCLASLLSIVVDGARVRSELMSRGSRPPMIPGGELTERQVAILRLIGEGKTNRAIGTNLGYSESTVRHETMRIFRALGVSSRSQAVTVGAARGLLPIPRSPLD